MFPSVLGIELYRPILVGSLLLQLALLFWLVRRDGFAVRDVVLYVALLGVFGFVGAKLASIVFHGELRSANVELTGGLRYPGALIGVLGFGYLLRGLLPAGLSYARFADLWAPSFALACAVGRLGCFFMGCCYGSVCALPWRISYPRGSVAWWEHYHSGLIDAAAAASLPVHPLPLYLFAMELGVLALTLHLLKRRSYDGRVVLVFLAVHGLSKSAIEFTRHPFHPAHLAVLPVALVAGAVLIARWRRETRDIVVADAGPPGRSAGRIG